MSDVPVADMTTEQLREALAQRMQDQPPAPAPVPPEPVEVPPSFQASPRVDPDPPVRVESDSHLVRAEAAAKVDPDQPVTVRRMTIEWRGQQYTVRADALHSVDVQRHLEKQQYIQAMERILGVAAFERALDSIRDGEGVALDTDLEPLLDKVLKTLDPRGASRR